MYLFIFCSWIISFSIVTSGSIFVVSNGNISFLLNTAWCLLCLWCLHCLRKSQLEFIFSPCQTNKKNTPTYSFFPLSSASLQMNERCRQTKGSWSLLEKLERHRKGVLWLQDDKVDFGFPLCSSVTVWMLSTQRLSPPALALPKDPLCKELLRTVDCFWKG